MGTTVRADLSTPVHPRIRRGESTLLVRGESTVRLRGGHADGDAIACHANGDVPPRRRTDARTTSADVDARSRSCGVGTTNAGAADQGALRHERNHESDGANPSPGGHARALTDSG